MFQHQGIWLPAGETHLPEWMNGKGKEIVDGKGTYQIKKLRRAVSYCKQRRVAADCGGHVGTWARILAKMFDHVHSFEPLERHRECFVKNMDTDNYTLHPVALGEHDHVVAMTQAHEGSSGSYKVIEHSMLASVDESQDGNIPMKTLDSFELQNVDLIKLDLEGWELYALQGATDTIERCRPVIIVEQKPGRAQRFGLGERDALPFVESLGYKLVEEISGDFILIPQ